MTRSLLKPSPSYPEYGALLSHAYLCSPRSLLNPIHPLSSPHLGLFTSASLLFFLKMKTSSWTMLDRLLRQASSDLNLSPLLSPMKVSTMENLVGRYAFQSHRQTLVRRFSSTVTFRQGPHSGEALDGALRLATSFSYNNDASHVLFNSPFLRLPDLSVLRPPRIDSYETPSPPEHAVREWLNNRAPRLIPSRYREYSQFPLGLLTISTLTFTCLRSECSSQLTSVIMKKLLLKHANTNVIFLLLLFFESYPPVQSCLATDFVKFIHTKIPWNLENLNSTRNPQVR